MSETIEMFGFGTNDRSSKVRWVAHELGLDVKENRVEPGKHFSEEYRALNPLSIIPAVVFRDEIYVESTAICHFLADIFPESGLSIAPGSPFRYDFLKWTSMFTETMLEWDQVKGYLRPLADRPAAKAADFFGDLPS